MDIFLYLLAAAALYHGISILLIAKTSISSGVGTKRFRFD